MSSTVRTSGNGNITINFVDSTAMAAVVFQKGSYTSFELTDGCFVVYSNSGSTGGGGWSRMFPLVNIYNIEISNL